MGRMTWPIVGVGVAALAAGTAFAGTQYASRASIDAVVPAEGSAIRTTTPTITLDTANVHTISDIKVTVDGRDRTDLVGYDGDGRLVLRTAALKDGSHTVAAHIASRNLFARNVSREWKFDVDTTPPPLRIASPKPKSSVNRRAVPVSGRTEPGSTVRIRWAGGSRTVTARGKKGAFSTTVPLKEGLATLKISATDRAGNTTRRVTQFMVDTKAPALTMAKVPTTMTETDTPVFTGRVSGEDTNAITVGAIVNGRTVTPARSDSAEGSSGPTVSFTGDTFSLSVGALPQGKNTVTVFAADPAGNRATTTSSILVDSTEEFGSKDMRAGARGADVKALQQGLVDRRFKKVKVTGVYDRRTEQGVRRYQAVHKLSQNGIFGPRTREAFFGKIVVTLSKFRLQLFRDGKVVKTYKVAVGAPGFATPTGSYVVVNKQVDPTWFPPDSPWAKGLGSIPPGPGNPLGTRWIGTSAPAVGIHGTYAASSIGTAASHGCIRMNIADVEELYDEVAVGMPVTFNP